jgi:D-3-phosphoglycerate dehydrogenase
MKLRIAIGPSSFAEEDQTPLRLLQAAGVEIVPNPFRRRLSETEILTHLVDIDGLIAGLEPLNRRVLSAASPRLKAIARVGIGMSNVDQDAARDLGIKVSNTPDGPTEAVAELTLASLLCLARNIEASNRRLHAGEWPKTIGLSIAELTALVVGYGRIGRRVASLLAQMGASILICDPYLPAEASTAPFPRVSLDEGLAMADVVTLHASGDKPILGETEFSKVRKGLILLNSARGELVDEAALVRALESGQVGKAWFDAFWREPYTGPLAAFPQVLMTPHSATYTRRCRLSMESEAVRNLLRDLNLDRPSPTP